MTIGGAQCAPKFLKGNDMTEYEEIAKDLELECSVSLWDYPAVIRDLASRIQEWQSVETAPTNGTIFDAWCIGRGSKGIRIPNVQMRGDKSGFGFIVHSIDGVSWNYLDARERNEAIFPAWEMTHWMKRPVGPKQ